MTPLYLLNYCILQWFFIRLAKIIEKNLETGEERIVGWTILRWVVPLSGFGKRDYRYLGR